ncbi:MAG: ABC transporter permease [Sulfurimonadaceae bacterium]|nr:ABC transporter permease [Sulfurimonadaceae bacterium]
MQTIAIGNLALAFIPAVIVIAYMFHTRRGHMMSLYALARMVIQLVLIGYVLIYIFESEQPAVVLATLGVMMLAASYIALRTVAPQRKALFGKALLSIAIGGGGTLALVTQGVLQVDPWYEPSVMIPLGGMIFAASMNAIALAAERREAELALGKKSEEATGDAFHTSLIPIMNSLFAVGLVTLPGMMTGQILSGVSPLIAARYQIMVMAMIFGATGLSALLFLHLTSQKED